MLGGEAWPQSREYSALSPRGMTLQEPIQDEQHGDARHVAVLSQYLPGEFETASPYSEGLLVSLQHLWASRMQDKMLEAFETQTQRIAGGFEVPAHLLSHYLRNTSGKAYL